MLRFPVTLRVFVCLQPTDMRRSFDGLAAMVQHIIQADPFANGHLFVFRNRRGDSLKVLYWDRDGFAIWYKRLEKGTFRLPAGDGEAIEVTARDLWMLLEGVEPATVQQRARYQRPGQK